MSSFVKIKGTLKELSTLTQNEIETFSTKSDVKCPYCDINVQICTPKKRKTYVRTYPGEENNHKRNCCFFKEKYSNKFGSFKNAIEKGKNSRIYSFLKENFKDLKKADIIDLNAISISEISIGRNYYYGKIYKILILNDSIYINFVPRNINNNKFFIDILLNKKFFEENNIKLEDAKKVFEQLATEDIKECIFYGSLEHKNKNNGFNIKPIHVLDFLIDGLGIDEIIIKNNIHLGKISQEKILHQSIPQGFQQQEIPQGECPF